MNEFERLYYEDDSFWAGNALKDENNIARIKYTADLVPDDAQSLVDVGCGNGLFLNHFSRQKSYVRLLGIDRSERALSYVKTNKLLGDVSDIKLDDGSFDCVTCLEVLEHLPIGVYHSALSELARISKKYIIVSVPFEEKLEESSNQCPYCKTIFNYELHLRNFNDEKINSLFDRLGFVCKVIDHLGKSEKLKFHRYYRKIFYPEQFKKFHSPICPVCGYRNKRHTNSTGSSNTASKSRTKVSLKKRILSTLSALPKTIWPKEIKFYWVIALYEKSSERIVDYQVGNK